MTAPPHGHDTAAARAAPTAYLGEDANVVFLDIDHTLHATDAYLSDGRVTAGSPASTLFEFTPIFERLLAPYPQAVIILSSSWVHVLGYAFTVAQLPTASLQARVRGATFESGDAADDGWSTLPRGTHVLRFVRRHKVKGWLAIDDDRKGFDGYESHLIHCQHGIGLGDKDIQQLFARRLELMFGPPDSLSHTGASTPARST
ncbi:HAD domain-containing protein [Paraburkholderia terrae]|uniref:HAD domain-containing protein n=1 Tax=Paraburkholderia terrae TaxID=311230 RepID=UPI0030DF32BD